MGGGWLRSAPVLLALTLLILAGAPSGLFGVADGPSSLSWKGHDRPVSFVAFTPDSQRVVSGCWDSSIVVWDAATGKEVRRLQDKSDAGVMEIMAQAQEGQMVASGRSAGGVIRLLDTKTGKVLHELPGHRHGAIPAFSPDGKVLATSSQEDPVRFWDVATGKQTGSLNGKVDAPASLCFAPDGKTLAIGTFKSRKVVLWDLVKNEEAASAEGFPYAVQGITYSPDGGLLAFSCGLGDPAFVLDAKTLKRHAALVDRRWAVHPAVAFAPDGQTLAVAGKGPVSARLWDLKMAAVRATLPIPGHTTAMAFSRDGKRLVLGGIDGSICVTDVPNKP